MEYKVSNKRHIEFLTKVLQNFYEFSNTSNITKCIGSKKDFK